MNNVAKNYCAALFKISSNFEGELNASNKLFEENPELINVLNNPRITKGEKQNIINDLFKSLVHETVFNFIIILSNSLQLNYFNEVCTEYKKLVLKSKNIIEATLIYAFLLDENEIMNIKKAVCEKFKASDVILKLEEDKSLIGGFIVKVNNTILDRSIKGTVKEMHNSI